MEANARPGLIDGTAFPNQIFDSTSLRAARMAVVAALDRDVDLVVVIGESGCGKSILLRMVEDALRKQQRPVRLRGGWPDADAIDGFQCSVDGHGRAVLLIDDADQFERGLLRELLSLRESARGGQLVLAGTAALQTRLSSFIRTQRTCHVRLGALLRQEMEQFIAWRLAGKKAGKLRFDQAALDTAYAVSHGLPAALDELCTCALAMQKERIEAADIAQAAAFCEIARLARDAAPTVAAPKSGRAAEFIAAGLAAAIGIALGAVFLMMTVGVPQAAQRAAKLIHALDPIAIATTAARAIPSRLVATAAQPVDAAEAQEPPDAPEGSATTEAQPDNADETIPEEEEEAPPEAEPPLAEPAPEPETDLALPENAPPPDAAEEHLPPAPMPPAASVPEPAPQPVIAAPEPAPSRNEATNPRGPEQPSQSGTITVVPPTPPPTAANPTREPAGAATVAAPIARRPPLDIGPLMARGDAFLREGDIASARLFFERAAEQGDGTAMMALGRTYDPLELRRLGVLGLKSDANRAMQWYRSAATAGDASAQQAIGRLSEWIERTR